MERYYQTVRYDRFEQHLFATIEEVRDYATKGLRIYHNEWLNRWIGGITSS